MSKLSGIQTFDAEFVGFIPGTWLCSVKQQGQFRLLEAQLIHAALHHELSRDKLVKGCKVSCQVGLGSSPATITGIYVGGQWLWSGDSKVGKPKQTRPWQRTYSGTSSGRNLRNHT